MNFNGAYTAIVTPFDEHGEINWDSYGRLLDFQIEGGISGIVACGTTGESPTLSRQEKLHVFDYTRDKCKDKCAFIAGTGSNSTRDSISLSLEAIALGADALMIITPYYNKPGQEGLYRHFSEVAEAVAPFPMIIYNVPSRTNVHIDAKTVAKLNKEYSNIVGIKDASGNFNHLLNIKRLLPDSFDLLCGEDALLHAYLSYGAAGIISVASNIIPGKMQEFCQWDSKEDVLNSFRLQKELHPFIESIFAETNPIPVKHALNLMGFDVGIPRSPLNELSDHNKSELESILAEQKLIGS